MSSRPLEITVTAHTSAAPEDVLAAVTDFSKRRVTLWPNVKARYLKVHDHGDTDADVTEGTWITGVFWERERYDWSTPGIVTAVVTDSNVLEPGSRFEVRARPNGNGSDVEMTIVRSFRRCAKGHIGSVVNHLSGRLGWGVYLRRVLKRVERQ